MKKRKRRFRSVPLKIKERVLRAAIEETKPSEERQQHDETDAGGVISRVERLYLDKRIDRHGRDACNRLYRDWAIGVARVMEPPSGLGGSASADAGELRHLAAAERYREVWLALGRCAGMVLECLVCLEWTWQRIASECLGCRFETAQETAILCIKDLTEWYHGVDNGFRKRKQRLAEGC